MQGIRFMWTSGAGDKDVHGTHVRMAPVQWTGAKFHRRTVCKCYPIEIWPCTQPNKPVCCAAASLASSKQNKTKQNKQGYLRSYVNLVPKGSCSIHVSGVDIGHGWLQHLYVRTSLKQGTRLYYLCTISVQCSSFISMARSATSKVSFPWRRARQGWKTCTVLRHLFSRGMMSSAMSILFTYLYYSYLRLYYSFFKQRFWSD